MFVKHKVLSNNLEPVSYIESKSAVESLAQQWAKKYVKVLLNL